MEKAKICDRCQFLGPRSKQLPYVHAFTGCDTVSPFVGKGKKQHGRPGMCMRSQQRFVVA